MNEAAGALNWVLLEQSRPATAVKGASEAADFYINRILKEKIAESTEWVRKLKALLGALEGYVRTWHESGLAFDPSGTELSKESVPEISKPAAAGLDVNALFGAISKSSTSGLRKVEKSEMTHKNPDLRKTSAVTVKERKEYLPPGFPTSGTPVLSFAGQIWSCSYQSGTSSSQHKSVTIAVENMAHNVRVFGCKYVDIVVKGKCNSVSLEQCYLCNVVVDPVISLVEMMACVKVQLQSTDKIASITLDKSDEITIHLPNDSLNTAVTTFKTSAVNIVRLPKNSDAEDPVMMPVSESFITTFKSDGSGIVTCPVEHVG